MSIKLELQILSVTKTLPHPAQFREWIGIALWNRVETGEITIRIVDEEESATLNEQYRGKMGPTNVLSFPYDPIPGITENLLGDLIICAPLVEAEAQAQHKTLIAHWAHLVVHGTLHLLGFNHECPKEAAEMEGLETELLLKLGFPPPYGDVIQS